MQPSPRLSPRISIPKLPIGGTLRSKTLDEKRAAFQERRHKAAAERAAQAARARAAAAASDDGGLSQQHQEVLMKLMAEFPDESPEELSARFAEMMQRGGVAPPPSMAPVDPQHQQRVLEELLQQYPDKPLEELAMMATERIEGTAPAANGTMPGGGMPVPGGGPMPGLPMMPGGAANPMMMMMSGLGQMGMPAPGGGAPWDDHQPPTTKKAAESPEKAQKRARARAKRANPGATEAELDVLALDHVAPPPSYKKPPAQQTMTPAENYRRAVEDVKRARPSLADPEAVAQAAFDTLQSPRAMTQKAEAAMAALRALPPAKRQQKILMDLLEEFPDRPLEELAAEAAARLDAVARPSGAPDNGIDADLIKELARRHPDKSPAEVAAVATRIAAERATRDRTAGSAAAAASARPRKKAPGGLAPIEESPAKKPPPVDRAALEAFAKMQSGGEAPGIDELRDLVTRTLADDPFADPDAAQKNPGVLSDMAKLGEAGVARVEAREQAAKEALDRRRATRAALSQAQVVENKMMARVLRGSSADVQLLVRHPGLWERWLGKLRKRGFFDDAAEGSPAFDDRVRKALRAFARSPGVREFDQ